MLPLTLTANTPFFWPSYSSGTRPWNRQFGEQRMDDGLIEVIGLTTYQMPLLQAGGHGHCITQCSTARVVTRKTIPMQVTNAFDYASLNKINFYRCMWINFLQPVCIQGSIYERVQKEILSCALSFSISQF